MDNGCKEKNPEFNKQLWIFHVWDFAQNLASNVERIKPANTQ